MDLLIMGLGNPGRQYEHTHHNVGFDFIGLLADKYSIHLKKALFFQAEIGRGMVNKNKIVLVRPQTFMNRSGDIFPKIFKYTGLSIENLIVVCDQLDLRPGVARLKKSGSSAGQKGLDSIIKKNNMDKFMRLFIGIGRPGQKEISIIDHVLSHPSMEDKEAISKIMEFSVNQFMELKEGNIERVIQSINSADFSNL